MLADTHDSRGGQRICVGHVAERGDGLLGTPIRFGLLRFGECGGGQQLQKTENEYCSGVAHDRLFLAPLKGCADLGILFSQPTVE